jgi:hypothetical protein
MNEYPSYKRREMLTATCKSMRELMSAMYGCKISLHSFKELVGS